MRHLLAVLSSAAIALGVLVGVASPANAASVSIDCENDSKSVSVAIDETLLITVGHCTIQSVSGVGTFSPSSGYAYPSVSFVSSTAGVAVLTVYGAGVAPTVLTVNVGGSGGVSAADLSSVYPTLYLNANEGTCTGTTQFTKYNGQNGTVTLPTSAACTRTDYLLDGWARSQSAASSEFGAGTTVPIGSDSFTLYAVWKPNGIGVVYDANVAMSTQCLSQGVNLATSAERSATQVITTSTTDQAISWDAARNVRWTSASPAPVCAPAGYAFDGWSTSPTGKVRDGGRANDIVTGLASASSSGLLAAGSTVTLYARWSVTYGLTFTQYPSTMATSSGSSVTVAATLNGAPAANVAVTVTASGAVSFGNGGTTATLTTAADGTATVPIYSGAAAGSSSVAASYGDRSSSVSIQVKAPAAGKSITITGERTTVSGKPGISVDGFTTGFAAGERLVPWFRFPGETTYTQGSARPEVDASGEVVWQRKTGKKFYAYLASEDGKVTSNKVIIPAN